MAVIARAPLRISIAGGGTDLPAYAERFGGLVISTSINRYVYTILTAAPDDTLQITAANERDTDAFAAATSTLESTQDELVAASKGAGVADCADVHAA